MDERLTARWGRQAAVAADRRLPLFHPELVRKIFPDHWSFLLGELALYSFLVLVATGVFLTMFFVPSMTETVYHGSYVPLHGVRMSDAYRSALDLSFDVRGGLLVRQIHHWAALVFIAAAGCHLLRIFFTGAFRRPREINWLVGVTLFALAIFEGFCGYSLPDDLMSGTGLRTAEGIVLSVPIIGTYLQVFLFGGQYPGTLLVPRLYVAHVLLVPGLIMALLGLHLTLVVYLKHTHWGGPPGRTNANVAGKPLFPQYLAKSAGLFLTVAGVLALAGALFQINPIWVFGPYRPDQVSTDAQPDWYIGFLEGALRTMPAAETRLWGHTVAWDVFLPGVVTPIAMFVVLYAYPFVERFLTDDHKEHHACDRPRNHPTRTALGAAGVAWYAVLLFAGGQDVFAYVFSVQVEMLTWWARVGVFAVPLLVFFLTRRICRGLQADDAARLARGTGVRGVALTVRGGYAETHEPLPVEEERGILVRDRPRAWAPRQAGPPRFFQAVRTRLSAWFVARPVPLPGQEEASIGVAVALADPDQAETHGRDPDYTP
jgi:ubiquinol-cytochrome c reductase cytochrome b subunit